MANKVDDETEAKVAPKEELQVPKPSEAQVVEPPAPKPEKLQLTTAELDAKIAEAVANAEREKAEQLRLEQAEKDKNYQLLMEEAQKDALKAKRELWVQQALNKHKLADSLGDSLTGETREAVMASAKKLREVIDTEIALKAKTDIEENPPPDPKSRINSSRVSQSTKDAVTRQTIKNTLGIGVLH